MSATSNNQWWIVLLYGILSVILGIYFFVSPGLTLVSVVFVVGVYWLVTGIIGLFDMFQDRTAWGWKLFFSVIGILAGLMVISRPLWAALVVPSIYVIIIAVWGLILGIGMLISAFKGAGWGTGIMGVLAIIMGFYLLSNPLAAVVVLPFVLGSFALIGGLVNIFLAFQLKSAS